MVESKKRSEITTEPCSSAGRIVSRTSWLRLASKQQLGLRRHGKTFRRELEEVANLFADGSAAGLARDEDAQASLFEARREPLHLR